MITTLDDAYVKIVPWTTAKKYAMAPTVCVKIVVWTVTKRVLRRPLRKSAALTTVNTYTVLTPGYVKIEASTAVKKHAA
jgi:hypothetical protein